MSYFYFNISMNIKISLKIEYIQRVNFEFVLFSILQFEQCITDLFPITKKTRNN